MQTSTTTRREALRAGAAAFAASVVPGALRAAAPASQPHKSIWAYLLHLGCNLWCDWDYAWPTGLEYANMTPNLRFDEKLWNEMLERMVDAGLNMVVIDLADGVRYESHPEIAVKNAWSVQRLREELARLRGMGLEPIPKLNFSATHDVWLKDYARQVSTKTYYAVCRDLIAEVAALFEKPRFFHLGMDEETAAHQASYQYAVVRQHDLWWHDFLFYVELVEKSGSRPWIWSDYVWNHPREFLERMPRRVLQSNWYYGTKFDRTVTAVDAYHQLEKHNYEQVPTASNHDSPDSLALTVEYCSRHIPRQRLLGFMQTPWRPTTEQYRKRHLDAIEQVKRAVRAWESKGT